MLIDPQKVYCVHAGRHECGVCDAGDPHKSHPAGAAVDGEETWWQSPSLQNGPEFHYVTVTVDLKEVGRKQEWNLHLFESLMHFTIAVSQEWYNIITISCYLLFSHSLHLKMKVTTSVRLLSQVTGWVNFQPMLRTKFGLHRRDAIK